MHTILVVDDDEAMRRVIKLNLADGYRVFDTGEPEHALALALEHKPDAILLDLRMPRYSGFELCQTFTSFSRTQTIPVVIVSGEAGTQTKEYCKQLGAAAYFEKTVDFEALKTCLNEIVKDQRYTPRSEVRVRLRIWLKLRGKGVHGNEFEEAAMTENVSLSGFLCTCTPEIAVHSVVDIYMGAGGEEYVGKAEV